MKFLKNGQLRSMLTVLRFISVLSLAMLLILSSCNKNCKSLENTIGGEVVKLYDFGDCYVYASVDSNLVIKSDSAFTAYKTSHFIHCNSAALESIDFSKYVLLGYRTEIIACNSGTHRSIEIDNTAKTYTYSMKIKKCTGCNSNLRSSNFVLGPSIPAGYSLVFKTSED